MRAKLSFTLTVNYLDASSLLVTPSAHHSLGNSDEEIGNYF